MSWPIIIGGEVFNKADFDPYTYVDTLPRLMEAAARHALNAYSGTSTTSLAVGTGTKNLTITGANGQIPAFKPGARVVLADQAAPATNAMTGILSAYDPTTGAATLESDGSIGSGTIAAWYVNLSGEKGVATGATSAGTYVTTSSESSLSNSKVIRGRRGVRSFVNATDSTLDVEAETLPVTASGTTYTQLVSDRGTLTRCTNAAGCAVTGLRPHDSSGAPSNAPTGFLTWYEAVGGAITYSPSTGTVTTGAVTGAASFLFPKGSLGFILSLGGDVCLAVIVRHARTLLEVTGDTTIDRSHAGTLVAINSATARTMTLPQTDALGVGVTFEIEFQAVTGFHTIARAGSNVFDKSGGGTSVALIEGQGIKLRSNGLSGAAGIWVTQRGGPGVLSYEPQYFLSSGTWNLSSLPPQAKGVVVEVDAGGGSGGAGRTTDSMRGGGGGGGGRSIKYIARASLGTTETVTVAGTAAGVTAGASPTAGNAGGTSSFGAHCSATGGQGGVAANGSVQAGVAGGKSVV